MTRTADPGEPPEALILAIKRLLRPLLRVFISYGVTLPVLSRLLKELYVSQANSFANARKYGSLSQPQGNLATLWS